MHTQALLERLTEPRSADSIFDTTVFIEGLSDSRIAAIHDPFERLVHAALQAGSQANAGIACLLYTSDAADE